MWTSEAPLRLANYLRRGAGSVRCRVKFASADNVLEGWEPERADVDALVDVVRGRCTTSEYIERVRRDLIVF